MYIPGIDGPMKKTPYHFHLEKGAGLVYLYVVFHFVASFLAHKESRNDRRLIFFLPHQTKCGLQVNTFTTFNLENTNVVSISRLLLFAMYIVCVYHPFFPIESRT